MPRLRKTKNFNFKLEVLPDFDSQSDSYSESRSDDFLVREPIFDGEAKLDTQAVSYADNNCKNSYTNALGEASSGEHWLSNNRIIASLAEREIKNAISYHKLQIAALQEELDARASGLRKQELFPNPKPSSCSKSCTSSNFGRSPSRTKNSSRKNKAKLSKEAKLVALLLKLPAQLVDGFFEDAFGVLENRNSKR